MQKEVILEGKVLAEEKKRKERKEKDLSEVL